MSVSSANRNNLLLSVSAAPTGAITERTSIAATGGAQTWLHDLESSLRSRCGVVNASTNHGLIAGAGSDIFNKGNLNLPHIPGKNLNGVPNAERMKDKLKDRFLLNPGGQTLPPFV